MTTTTPTSQAPCRCPIRIRSIATDTAVTSRARAAGFGVLANGSEYTGSYDQLTHLNNSFLIGPGVAPKADLYAVRVFGCEGSTNVVTEAIEWAIDNDMDVINMSLGSDFGAGDTADAMAADDASKAGVVVVSAAGNAGDISYVLGSPGSSTKGIAVAAGAKEAQRPHRDLRASRRAVGTGRQEHPGDQCKQRRLDFALDPERGRAEGRQPGDYQPGLRSG